MRCTPFHSDTLRIILERNRHLEETIRILFVLVVKSNSICSEMTPLRTIFGTLLSNAVLFDTQSSMQFDQNDEDLNERPMEKISREKIVETRKKLDRWKMDAMMDMFIIETILSPFVHSFSIVYPSIAQNWRGKHLNR